MFILGIDPGLQKTGWGIVHSQGNRLQYCASGLIKTDKDASLGTRLATLYSALARIIEEHSPQAAAIEETFVNKNAASALKLGQARGVLLCVPAIYGLEVAEYAANKIKKSIVGIGHADKNQMGLMIKRLLPSSGTVTEDEADALAVAICHAHHKPLSFRRKPESTSLMHEIPAFAGMTRKGK